MKQKSRGFTLVEMLVTIAIFVVVFSIAATLIVEILKYMRKNRANLALYQETRYITEIITRSTRYSQGDSPGLPSNKPFDRSDYRLTLHPNNKIYSTTTSGGTTQSYPTLMLDDTYRMTSNEVNVINFKIGNANSSFSAGQPFVVIDNIELVSSGGSNTKVNISTIVSSRAYK